MNAISDPILIIGGNPTLVDSFACSLGLIIAEIEIGIRETSIICRLCIPS